MSVSAGGSERRIRWSPLGKGSYFITAGPPRTCWCPTHGWRTGARAPPQEVPSHIYAILG
eukprot:CAMPEP_0174325980 /NCGR_PEP_ID=MMETSP0810-20121108/13612_1 /TAXON_ID=73025 ORGANISM="Eutreptiella gymnastica-like, Strain CCMP1594" /NCGR_SAMPLE_ID=MMETSP0810 /ASSEMBLY_ACC=CAM_ASM_000659 /LENGTH=59 /DNA_ID=CAMNT_0015439475 /DNA_START=300 /DNA_END=479 /DNA_ORIENTATION=+